jgi:HEAT repeat protein
VEILFGLGQVQSGLAVSVLADFARNPNVNERLRIKTLETLGQIGHPSSIPLLAEFIRRKGRIFSTAEPTEIRLAAARALMALGLPQASDGLRKLVEEEPRNKDREALQQVLDTPSRPQGAS